MLLRQRERLLENAGRGGRLASTEHQDATAIGRRDAIEWPQAFVGYLLSSPLKLVGRIELPQRGMGEGLHHAAHQQHVLDGGADRALACGSINRAQARPNVCSASR